MMKYSDRPDAYINAKDLEIAVVKATSYGDALNAVREAPSIEIIHCRECKYASDDGTYGCMCEHFNDTSDAYHRMWSDDFCSRGERNSSVFPNNSKVSEIPTGSERSSK